MSFRLSRKSEAVRRASTPPSVEAGPVNAGPVATPFSRLSMHAGVAVWCDCCSCAAEPYWAEQAAALGIELEPEDRGGD